MCVCDCKMIYLGTTCYAPNRDAAKRKLSLQEGRGRSPGWYEYMMRLSECQSYWIGCKDNSRIDNTS